MKNQAQTKLKEKILKSTVIVAALLLLVILVIQYRRASQRATKIREAATEVRGGNLKVLVSGDGQVPTDLLEAAGEGPREQQPPQVKDALSELHEAILGKARQLHNGPELTQSYRDRVKDLLIVAGTRLAPEQEAWEKIFQPHLENRLAVLTNWLQETDQYDDRQLEIINQALKKSLEMKDTVFASFLHERRLEIWSASITAKGEDAQGRIFEIRKLVQSVNGERDAQLKLKSLKFLARQVIEAMMLKKDEAQLINNALVELRPNLKGLMESGLRFEVVLSSITSCDSGDACKVSMERLQKALEELRAMSDARRPSVESTLKDIFDKLPLDAKREIWEVIFKQIEASYLFTVESGAWPGGITPLPVRARRVLRNNPKRASELLDEFLDRLASRPVYETEAHYLLRATERKWAEHRLIENCYTSMVKIRTRSWPPFKSFEIIRDRLLKNQTSREFEWDVVPVSNKSLSNEADQILGRLFSLRRSGWPYKPAPQDLIDALKATLMAHCRSMAGTRPKECN